MKEIAQTEVFRRWEAQLKDQRLKTIIAARLFRLANGLPGDVKPIGEGVSELRIHHGPGYRVYFKQHGNLLIILLCGGDKQTQGKDITLAKSLANSLDLNKVLAHE